MQQPAAPQELKPILVARCQHDVIDLRLLHNPAQNASLFWSFPYICPEPVLVKRSLKKKKNEKAQKKGVLFAPCGVGCERNLTTRADRCRLREVADVARDVRVICRIHLCFSVSYVCPEPVLVKTIILC